MAKKIQLLLSQIDPNEPNGEIVRENLNKIKGFLDEYFIDEDDVSDLIYNTENLLTQYSLTVTGTNWTTIRAIGLPYRVKDESDNVIWRLRFNMSGTLSTAAADLTLSIDKVTFKNVTNLKQAISVYWDAGTYEQGYASPNTGDIVIKAGASDTAPNISGDVELDEKPKFIS